MLTCAFCQEDIPDATGFIMEEDDYSAWLFHPTCHETWLAQEEAKQQAELQAQQALERAKIAAWNALSQQKGENPQA